MASFVSRYARAFADVIFESKLDAKAMQQQLADFAAAWHESRELREFLVDPSFPVEQKVVSAGQAEREAADVAGDAELYRRADPQRPHRRPR